VIVLKDPLTDAMIEAGAALVRKLDEAGVPITTALWLFDVENAKWKLLFGSPEVATKTPQSVYHKIGEAIDALGEKASPVSMWVVSLMLNNAELARQLREGVQAGTGIHRIRLRRSAIRGHIVEDALVYRAA